MKTFLDDLEGAAGTPIQWVIAEARGDNGRRFHHHVLISHVRHLDIDIWEDTADCRFGESRFEVYNANDNGARYIAQNGLSESGEFYFSDSLNADREEGAR